MKSLYIVTKDIGEGFFIQHGFSTIIHAKKIGKNCWVNQQVTIGYSKKGNAPIIGNNVTIHAGAIIVGDIKVGDNVTIGAGAVVTKDVPSSITVIGSPSFYIKKDDINKIKYKL